MVRLAGQDVQCVCGRPAGSGASGQHSTDGTVHSRSRAFDGSDKRAAGGRTRDGTGYQTGHHAERAESHARVDAGRPAGHGQGAAYHAVGAFA